MAKADIPLTYWNGGSIQPELDGFIADPERINFNGKGKDCHETFYITRTAEETGQEDKSFSFCKTARKPYDKYVVACLLLAKYHFAHDDFTIRSDAYVDNWKEGLDLLNNHFPYGCSFDMVDGVTLDEGVVFLHPKKTKKSKKKYADEIPESKESKESKLKATPEEIHYFEINYMQ